MKLHRLLKLSVLNIIIILIGSALLSCKKSDGTKPTPPAPPVTPSDPPAYAKPFSAVPDTKDIVMYEVNLRAFSKDGNFQGVRARLDSIKSLGINVIWLMPTYPVGQVKSAGGLGSPYSIKDYKDVNTEFGTLDDLRTLIKEAHDRNMAVIFDWVADHTSWDNSWISNKSWYKQDAAGNIISPPGTNWADVAALNYNNQEMRKAMISAMKYWILQANIDGYRCDAADFLPFDFWEQATDTLKKFTDRKLILLAEGTRTNHFDAGFQMTYAMEFYTRLKSVFGNPATASDLFTTNSTEQTNLNNSRMKLRYTTNHDVTSSEGTPVDLFGGKDGSLAALALSIYTGGVPLIYNGQEVGCPKKLSFFDKDPIDWTINPDMTAAYKKLIAFRKSSEAVKTGMLTSYPSANVVAFTKTSGSETVMVIVNVSGSQLIYPTPQQLQNTSWKDAFSNTDFNAGTGISLKPYQYLVLKK
ncbi:alpha-amylase [Pedobacter sp. HMF7647]|uniref:Alpha-amylase n=1 Tax=Hufsiella arboris TaxID=2695275 RepID=A0A7K1YBY5_9SPHI|nr:alpha-amylase family glycosyl hydrolase [Hufsiella arboris]MXV52104.1 alpha-amylase [Hufsiella arboris]